MNTQEITLSKGIILHTMKTDRFKTNYIIVNILASLDRNSITKNALLPLVLRRGTEKYPSMKEISTKLENMYGAILDANVDKIGNNSIIQFAMDTISDEYTLEKSDVLRDGIDLICEMILNPRLENGVFCKEFVEQEKETLKEIISSKINDKGSYAYERCVEEMYKDEPYGLYKFGYIEDLESINAENLFSHYLNILETSKIHIYVSGNFCEQELANSLKTYFSKIERNMELKNNIEKATNILNNMKNFITDNKSNSASNDIVEHQNVIQGKLVLGYKLDSNNLKEDFYKMTVYSAILGGTASSKLFNNVREKKSLAYTINSVYIKHNGALFVNAGIELDNYDLAKTCILKEINDMATGEIQDSEINDAKANLITKFKSFNDSQSALIAWAIGQKLLDSDEDINVVVDKINAVTKDDIIEVASRLHLSTSYYLTA